MRMLFLVATCCILTACGGSPDDEVAKPDDLQEHDIVVTIPVEPDRIIIKE